MTSGLVDTVSKEMRSYLDLPWLSSRARHAMLAGEGDANQPSPVVAMHALKRLRAATPGVADLANGLQVGNRPPARVLDFVKRSMDDGDIHEKGNAGDASLRQAMAESLLFEKGWAVDPDREILPTAGCQMALDVVLRLLVNPGDEVVVTDPCYLCFEPMIRAYGGVVVPAGLHYAPGAGWGFDVAEVASRVTFRTKLVMISNGENPTGILYSREDLQDLLGLARERGFYILSDEAYEKVVFDGRKHYSVGSFEEGMDRVFTTFGFSKGHVISGFRVGCLIGTESFVEVAKDAVRFTVSSVPSVSQNAAVAILRNRDAVSEWVAESTVSLQRRRDIAVAELSAVEGVACNNPVGAYYVFPDVGEIERIAGVGGLELVGRLVEEQRVYALPGYFFGKKGAGHLRVAFCLPEAQVVEGLRRLCKGLTALAAGHGGGRRRGVKAEGRQRHGSL